MPEIRAVIADDEAPLRQSLRRRLAEVWPELVISGEAPNGEEALALIERHHPQVAFLDIRMPGLTGIEVAGRLGDSCRVVFVTAFDDYAVEAFEKEAVDYLLKPVTRERLEKTVRRLRPGLETGAALPAETLQRLLDHLAPPGKSRRLRYLRIQQGDGVRLIPAADVIYFQAQDKYTSVVTREGESLIRKSIRDLTAELDPDQFWQIHRGILVNVRCIARVGRSLTGKGVLKLKDRDKTLPVSNRYLHRFRQM